MRRERRPDPTALPEVDLELYQKRPREKFSQFRIICALQRAAKQRRLGRGPALKLLERAAKILCCSPGTIRSYVRRHPKVRAVKLELDAEWRKLVNTISSDMAADLKRRQDERQDAGHQVYRIDFAGLKDFPVGWKGLEGVLGLPYGRDVDIEPEVAEPKPAEVATPRRAEPPVAPGPRLHRMKVPMVRVRDLPRQN